MSCVKAATGALLHSLSHTTTRISARAAAAITSTTGWLRAPPADRYGNQLTMKRDCYHPHHHHHHGNFAQLLFFRRLGGGGVRRVRESLETPPQLMCLLNI
ncbi:hypothetical protein ElyMa_004344300 [Elysia marginata]|uniref:Secreted protein n=1 Tax=Elysia marginata TaxID=1093978 RepID=A0AAV4H3J2_9GAST|nr:hypothetical protein ElyMa_004344300 [Elysia marginata]